LGHSIRRHRSLHDRRALFGEVAAEAPNALRADRQASAHRGWWRLDTRGVFELDPHDRLRLRRDGSGTIIFGNPSWTQAAYADSGADFFGSDSGDWIGFYDIPDARSVVNLVNEERSRPSSEEQY
jgi:hypothetical protein